MFQVKICGVRLKSDVAAVAAAGGDAVGLNFFPPSVRFVDPMSTDASQLADAARGHALRTVGVFVNEPVARIRQISEWLNLDAVQLHGDESIDQAIELQGDGLTVIRAIKLPVADLTTDLIDAATGPAAAAGLHLLLDADAGRMHGGSGKTLHWPAIHQWSAENPEARWTLAGGLDDDNVRQAVEVSGATSVDVASGVERPRGVKNDDRIRRFVSEFQAAKAG
ncbi:phosphoribosylanthranilate isomerase [Crateriforma conspicua]|uniref:N-(5'-phosphoribosyl)anthranilate isomerase n=1 Tax=Crateriforma conspicua TaxID=2527996 RepID=A0A5C6G0G0_9PLAN|nr:phosphoribosylanthranilate isomerase [Crateriforma conspicua]TWU67375.1 N-(5'-phosphoribosyl)anthranilate isomerase [Crateriforma conspicua]